MDVTAFIDKYYTYKVGPGSHDAFLTVVKSATNGDYYRGGNTNINTIYYNTDPYYQYRIYKTLGDQEEWVFTVGSGGWPAYNKLQEVVDEYKMYKAYLIKTNANVIRGVCFVPKQ